MGGGKGGGAAFGLVISRKKFRSLTFLSQIKSIIILLEKKILFFPQSRFFMFVQKNIS